MKVDVTALVDHNLIKMHTVPLYKPEFHNTLLFLIIFTLKDSRLQVSLFAVLLTTFLPLRRTCFLSFFALVVLPKIHLELHIFCQNPVFGNVLLQLLRELNTTNTYSGNRSSKSYI